MEGWDQDIGVLQATIFFKDFIYLFLEEEKGGREGEKHQCVVASHAPPTGDLAWNPGMCPDWESNWGPFGLQASTQSTELHQSGRYYLLGTFHALCPFVLNCACPQIHMLKFQSSGPQNVTIWEIGPFKR